MWLDSSLILSFCLQVQCSFQERNPALGAEAVQLHGDHREVVDCAEPLGLLGGCVCWRRHCKAAAKGET